MAVRTALFYAGPTPGVSTWTTVYTCPAGTTALLKDVRFAFGSGTATQVFLQALHGASGVNLAYWTGAFPEFRSLAPWVVLEPGDRLQVWSNIANGGSWWMGGAELLGLAP